ncbi:MAG: hypothetical protein H0T11_05610, partial [Chthoniobacterales bacterium]|nr:hypothetical protein [Chthoniobacterales bacterium]
MVVQLASLVDLLFVIMFMQYIELQEATARQIQAESAGRVSAERLTEQALGTQDDLNAAMQRLRTENDRLVSEVSKYQQQAGTVAIDVQQAKQELDDIAALVSEQFAIDGGKLASILSAASPKDRSQIRGALDRMKSEPVGRVVQHLRAVNELHKLCTVYEVHVLHDGSVRLRGADDAEESFFPSNANEVASRFVEFVKAAGEPHSLM